MRPLLNLRYILLVSSCLVCSYIFLSHDASYTTYTYRLNNDYQLRSQSDNVTSKTKESRCQPTNRIVFIKTHKTASTTLASIFERYGYSRNLTFGVGVGTHVLSSYKHFNRHMIHQSNSRHQYHFLTNHVRYNRGEMEAVFPNATYVTILRNPVSQFESAFGYFDFAHSAGITGVEDPIATFFDDPEQYYNKPNFYLRNQARNGQIYDLGLDTGLQNDEFITRIVFKSLKQELDIVLISEYFNHSLILMKRKLCWDWDDILYISKGIRRSTIRYQINPETRKQIEEWNSLDKELYDYYNQTLWRTIEQYGSDFWKDLEEFQNRLSAIKETCIDTSRRDISDFREDKIVIKEGASDFCKALSLDDVQYSLLIRKRQGAS